MLTRRTKPPSTWLNLHTSLGSSDLMGRGKARTVITRADPLVDEHHSVFLNQPWLFSSLLHCQLWIILPRWWPIRSGWNNRFISADNPEAPGQERQERPPKLPGSSTGLGIWKYYQESVTHLWRKRQKSKLTAFVLFMELRSHSEQVWELTLFSLCQCDSSPWLRFPHTLQNQSAWPCLRIRVKREIFATLLDGTLGYFKALVDNLDVYL